MSLWVTKVSFSSLEDCDFSGGLLDVGEYGLLLEYLFECSVRKKSSVVLLSEVYSLGLGINTS